MIVMGLVLVLPAQAYAHAFGARYDLPLPLWLYLSAAGAAVVASFLIMAWLPMPTRHEPGGDAPTDKDGQQTGPLAGVQHRRSKPSHIGLLSLRAACVALLLLVITAAFVGDDSATGNFATVFVWIIWWVGLVFFQALVVDLWTVLNPWCSLTRVVQCALRRVGVGSGNAAGPPFRYPQALGYWPAAALFLVFAWLELVSDLGEQPRVLGTLIVLYSITTVLAACLFGTAIWFSRADPFALVFGIFGRFAPLDLHGQSCLRIPGQGLLVSQAVPMSMVVVVMMLLATVSFDGFVETPPWAALLDWVTQSEWLRSSLLSLQGAGVDLLKLVKTLALLATVILFTAVYLAFAWLIDRCSGTPQGLRVSAGSYVLSLVPIAIGYHLAHYLSYLLIAGQLIIPLASDPFALGWDLFGTRAYSLDIAIVDARFVWYTAVGTIIGGHVIAVCLAHSMALRIYADRSRAIRSQLPMLVLMVAYTMTSLWILSQPIVAL
jgi:hypothetical protein